MQGMVTPLGGVVGLLLLVTSACVTIPGEKKDRKQPLSLNIASEVLSDYHDDILLPFAQELYIQTGSLLTAVEGLSRDLSTNQLNITRTVVKETQVLLEKRELVLYEMPESLNVLRLIDKVNQNELLRVLAPQSGPSSFSVEQLNLLPRNTVGIEAVHALLTPDAYLDNDIRLLEAFAKNPRRMLFLIGLSRQLMDASKEQQQFLSDKVDHKDLTDMEVLQEIQALASLMKDRMQRIVDEQYPFLYQETEERILRSRKEGVVLEQRELDLPYVGLHRSLTRLRSLYWKVSPLVSHSSIPLDQRLKNLIEDVQHGIWPRRPLYLEQEQMLLSGELDMEPELQQRKLADLQERIEKDAERRKEHMEETIASGHAFVKTIDESLIPFLQQP